MCSRWENERNRVKTEREKDRENEIEGWEVERKEREIDSEIETCDFINWIMFYITDLIFIAVSTAYNRSNLSNYLTVSDSCD